MILNNFGWTESLSNLFSHFQDKGYQPARISSEHRGAYTVITENGERSAEVSGNLRHYATMRSDFPAVGDWVALEIPDTISHCLIHGILPRFSSFIRKAAGTSKEEQILATNIDVVFLVSGLDNDYNPRRIERYLTLAYESGVNPIILLNKVDLATDLESKIIRTESIAYGVPILPVSALNSQGLESIWEHLKPGATGALLGSSGVGKSSLVNALLQCKELKTSNVREYDSRGRHTTTHRQLVPLPNGSMLIDTPGMRELQLFATDATLDLSFHEISDLSENCRYRDCSHTSETGCAVKEALETGRLDPERFDSYLRQLKEIHHHKVEQDIHLKIKEKNNWKAIYKSMKHHPKNKW